MNFFDKIVYGLDAQMQRPGMYGWFHLIFLAVTIIATVLLCVFCKNCSRKSFKWIMFSAWLAMLIFEIFKQLTTSFEYNPSTQKVVWDYEWESFPFQLCSTPLYILPFIAFCKEGKFRDSLIAFLSTFALFGGLATMLLPATVFVETVVINIQTMVHHGLQIVVGIFALVHERKKLNLKYFLRSLIVFGVVLVIALVSNLIMKEILTEKFNMFYISPYYPCVLPLLEIIYVKVPYVVFLLIYIIGFILAAFAIYMIQYGFIKLGMRKRKKESRQNE